MRIAVVIPSFLPAVGGAEFVAHYLAVEWGKQGHEVRVFNWSSDEATHPDANYGVAKFRLLRGAPRFGYHRFPFSWYTRRDLGRLLDAFDPHLVFGHMGYPTGHWLSRLRPERPYYITCHGRDITLFDWGDRTVYGIDDVLRDALDRSAGAIAISSFAARLMEDLGVPPERIHFIPNGVDVERFRREVRSDLRALLDLPAEARVVLSVGREHPQKAFAAGLEAFAGVAARTTNAWLVILGKGTEANLPLAERLGIADRVRLCEGLHGDDLIAAYQQADVLFSPSVWEMMPLVVLEAMAAGLPAVVTNISGSQDLVLDGETGFIVEPGALDDMADALVKLIEDDALRTAFARAAGSRAEDYSWERVSRRQLELAGAAK